MKISLAALLPCTHDQRSVGTYNYKPGNFSYRVCNQSVYKITLKRLLLLFCQMLDIVKRILIQNSRNEKLQEPLNNPPHVFLHLKPRYSHGRISIFQRNRFFFDTFPSRKLQNYQSERISKPILIMLPGIRPRQREIRL